MYISISCRIKRIDNTNLQRTQFRNISPTKQICSVLFTKSSKKNRNFLFFQILFRIGCNLRSRKVVKELFNPIKTKNYEKVNCYFISSIFNGCNHCKRR